VSKIVAIDIETQGLTGDVIYWSWAYDKVVGGSPVAGFREFTIRLCEKFLVPEFDGAFIVAHCGTRFDFLRIDFRILVELAYEGKFFVTNKDDVRGFDISQGDCVWRFRDSYLWVSEPLRDFARAFGGIDKLEGPEFDKGEAFDPQNRSHVEYAMRDAEALLAACKGYKKLVGGLGVVLESGVTASGHALSALRHHVRKTFGRHLSDFPTLYYMLGKHSLYGGFTQAFRIGKFKDVTLLDINSSYPAILEAWKLPYGDPFISHDPPDNPHLVYASVEFGKERFMGLSPIPVISSRPPAAKSRKAPPPGRYSGIVSGVWWNFELETQQSIARQMGFSVDIRPRAYLGFPSQTDEVQGFIEKLRELREKDYDGPLGMLAKKMGNSIYGKFSVGLQNADIVLSPSCPADGAFPLFDRVADFEDALPLPIWKIVKDPSKRTRVFWGSFVAALARMRLLYFLSRMPPDEWIYVDTDSLLVPDRHLPLYEKDIGPHYGMLKRVWSAKSVEIIAGKVYRAHLEDQTLTKVRGIPAFVQAEALDNGEAEFESLMSLQLVLRSPSGGVFGSKIKRAVSTSESVRVGKYVGGRWEPERVRFGAVPEIENLIFPSIISE